ncbi:MAG: hypothetical protein ACXVXY_11020 [Mycobacteriaceae bacterium]
MTGSGSVQALHTCDVDAIAAATSGCPAVAGLHEGGARAVATYLPGRRVVGVRVEDHRVLVSVVLASGSSVRSLEAQVRSALAPHVGGRRVDVHVADVQTVTDDAERA